MSNTIDTVVIGAGHAGLAVSHLLAAPAATTSWSTGAASPRPGGVSDGTRCGC